MEHIAQQIEQAIQDFLILQITATVDWDAKPDIARWSKKEVMGHLIDSASINLHRFVRCTYEQNFKLVYAQNNWVAAQHYQDAKIDDLLTLWRLLNKQICTILKNYPPELAQATCDTGKSEASMHTV